MILFYDACTVIYQVEAKAPWYERLHSVAMRAKAVAPDARIAVSALSLMECRVQPLREGDQRRLRLFDDFFALEGLIVVALEVDVLERAAVLRARTKLRSPDAIQAASALSLRGEVQFLTSDSAFRHIEGLNVSML